MKIRILRLSLLFTMIVMSSLSACQKADQDNLTDTAWRLTDLNGTEPIPGTRLTIEFEAGQISGKAGCNQYGGSYSIKGEKIEFDSVYNTEMACQTPEGVMEQEQIYLSTLRNAVRVFQRDENLILFDNAGRVLIFEPYLPPAAEGESDDIVDTVQVQTPTIAFDNDTPTAEIPAWEHHIYSDPITGITILIPDTWIVTGIIEGEFAILQSYPEDKYIGGEPREEGDTKCDLNIRPEGSSLEDLIEQWTSSSMTEILSDEPFLLAGGVEGRRFEIDSLGKSITFVAELEERLIVLSCFGNFDMVDEIAATLKIDNP